jgi:hypothetical protein
LPFGRIGHHNKVASFGDSIPLGPAGRW